MKMKKPKFIIQYKKARSMQAWAGLPEHLSASVSESPA